MKFGFLIDGKSFKCDGFKIAPVAEFSSVLTEFCKEVSVSKGWFYGPKIELPKSSAEKRDFNSKAVVDHSSSFVLVQHTK